MRLVARFAGSAMQVRLVAHLDMPRLPQKMGAEAVDLVVEVLLVRMWMERAVVGRGRRRRREMRRWIVWDVLVLMVLEENSNRGCPYVLILCLW